MSYTLPPIEALGTIWWFEFFEEISLKENQILHQDLASFIADFEQRFSRFRPNSLVSKLNQNHKLETNDSDLQKMLTLGQAFYQDTKGLFNLLLGEILINRGYDANYSFKPKSASEVFPNPLIDLVIKENKIQLLQGQLDLGGIGKGYLIDLIALRLTQIHQKNHFLINGGGDIFATSDQNNQPVEIYLEHPLKTKNIIGKTTLFHQGFAASSPHKRRWVVNNQTYSHIINPNENQLQIDGSFVKASQSATKADVFATITLLQQPENIETFAKSNNLEIAIFSKNNEEITGWFGKN